MKQIKTAELILDYNLYPRTQVDSSHVRFMGIAVDGGAKLPPPIIDKKSLRVIDGFHRVTLYKRLGTESIEVIEREYKNESEMFTDAIRMNANHGRNLSPYDRTHCILRAEELGMSVGQIAASLSMTVEAVGEMRSEKVGKMRVAGKSQDIAIKRTIAHMAGKQLNVRQFEANSKLGGMNQLFYVHQLIELIEADLIDWENDDLVAGLNKLADLLKGALKNVA